MYDVCVVDLEFVMMYDVLRVCFNTNNNNYASLLFTLLPIGELPPSATDSSTAYCSLWFHLLFFIFTYILHY